MHGAAPEQDVVLRVVEEGGRLGCEERFGHVRGRVVILRGQQHDEQVPELALGAVERLRVARLEPGELIGAILLLELADEACRRVARVAEGPPRAR